MSTWPWKILIQALSLPGEEAVRDCLEEREEVEGEALRRAQEACREGGKDEEGIEEEVDSKDPAHSDEVKIISEEDEKRKGSEYDVLDYEYSDNCSTFYDGRWQPLLASPILS